MYDDSFEQLLARDDLPAFDSISLHGVWSWVSRDNHRLITKFLLVTSAWRRLLHQLQLLSRVGVGLSSAPIFRVA